MCHKVLHIMIRISMLANNTTDQAAFTISPDWEHSVLQFEIWEPESHNCGVMGLQDAAGFSKITFSFTNRYKDKAGTNTKTKPNTNSNKKTKSQDWGVMGQEPSPNSTPPVSPGSLSPSVVNRATLLTALLSQRFTNNLSAAVKLCMKCTRARAFLDAILIAWNFIIGISMVIVWSRLLKDISM